MNIDFVKTGEKAKNELNLAGVARLCGVSGQTVSEVSRGIYRSMQSPTALRILERLREYGVVVELPPIEQRDLSRRGGRGDKLAA